MSDAGKAVTLARGGLMCSQAVLAEQLGAETAPALKMATGFAGGIAHRGDICGAVSGAIMAIGLKHGYAKGPDAQARDKVFALVQELIRRIAAKHGSYTCRSLTGLEWTGPESLETYYERGIPEKVCQHVIRDAVEIAKDLW